MKKFPKPKLKDRLPPVSTIVLNWNGIKYLKKCLLALERVNYPASRHEIIMVDNGSTDDSVSYVKKSFKNVKIIETGKNLGFAEGNNVGVRAAKHDHVMMLSNDTEVDRNWLLEAVKKCESGKNIAVVGAHIYNTGDYYHKEESIGTLLNLWGFPISTREKGLTFLAPGCSLLFKKSVIGEPFDRDYFIYSEDTYLSWKALVQGREVVIAEKSVLEHVGSTKIKEVPDLIEFHGEKNRVLNLLLFYEPLTLLKVTPLIFITSLMTILAAIPKGRLLIRLKSYLWLFANMDKIIEKRRKIQKSRRVPDSQLMGRMSSRLPYSKGLVKRLAELITKLYCVLARLPVHELRRK